MREFATVSGPVSDDVSPDGACGRCGARNPAGYRFCESCGSSLEVEAEPSAQDSDSTTSRRMPADAALSNRIELRLVLLLFGFFLLVLALPIYTLFGVQWTIAPAVLGAALLAMAPGRMSSGSRALFRSDLRILLAGSGTSAPAPEYAVEQTAYRTVHSVDSRPAAQSDAGASLEMERATVVDRSERPLTSDSKPAVSLLGLPEKQLGLVVLAAGLLMAALSLYMFPKGPPYSVAWWSFGLSVTLALGAVPAFEGGWSALFAKFRRGYQVSFEPHSLLPWFGLGVILLLAAMIRLHNLDVFPPGLWFDEADNLARARQIAEEPGSLPVFVPFTELPSLFLLPIAVVVKYAGVSMTTGRLVAVVFGLAGIVAIFLMVRQMSEMAMGLVAAFLTAVMRWDVIWSRTGMHGITAPFFAALTAWLTYRAVQKGGMADFAVAGAALGLGMWYYAAYRLFPLVIAFVLIHALITAKSQRRRLMLNIGIMAFFAAIVTLPLIQFATTQPDEFFRRTSVTSVFSQAPEGEVGEVVRESLIRHLSMFHLEGDPNGRHNIPGEPMLDVISGLLMLIGLAVAISRWRNAAYLVLPVWILVMLMPGVLTIPWEAPQSLRTITVIPAVIALITLGVAFIWRMGSSVNIPVARMGTAAVIALMLATIAYSNVSAYFGKQANDPDVYASYSTDDTLMARDMAEQAARGYSPMVSRQFRHSLVASLFGHRYPRQTIAAPTNIPLVPQSVWRGAAIYLEPRESGFYDALKAYYPSAEFREIRPPTGGNVLYYAVYISREELEAAQGLVSIRTAAGRKTIEDIKRSTESVWELEAADGDDAFDVVWEGTLHVTRPGEHVFALDGDSGATVTLDGIDILSGDRVRTTIEPAVGLHRIEVHSHIREADGVLRLLWREPADELGEGGEELSDTDEAEAELKPITAKNLYHGEVRPVGLAGRFFKAAKDASQIDDAVPDALQITPGIGGAFWYDSVVEGPHLAVWDGILSVPETGAYRFRFGDVHGEMRLVLNGDALIDTRGEREAETELFAGRHRIRMEYQTSAGSPRFEVLWTRPGEPEMRIEPEYLSPEPEHMFRIVE